MKQERQERRARPQSAVPSGPKPGAIDWGVTAKSAGKTVLWGGGTILAGGAAIGAGLVSAPVLIGGGLVLAAGYGISRGLHRWADGTNAGLTGHGGRAALAGMGDAVGVTPLVEGARGYDAVTTRALGSTERSHKLGDGLGGAALLPLGGPLEQGGAAAGAFARRAVSEALPAAAGQGARALREFHAAEPAALPDLQAPRAPEGPAPLALEEQRSPRPLALEDKRPEAARRTPAQLEDQRPRLALEDLRRSTPAEKFGKAAEDGLTAQYPGASKLPENYPAYDAYRGGTVTKTTTQEKIKGTKATVENEHVEGGEWISFKTIGENENANPEYVGKVVTKALTDMVNKRGSKRDPTPIAPNTYRRVMEANPDRVILHVQVPGAARRSIPDLQKAAQQAVIDTGFVPSLPPLEVRVKTW